MTYSGLIRSSNLLNTLPNPTTFFSKRSFVVTIGFKGKSHFKRQSGISVVSSLLFEKWEYDEEIIRNDLKNIFIKEFCSLNTDANESLNSNEELNKETNNDYEYIYINNKNNNIKAI